VKGTLSQEGRLQVGCFLVGKDLSGVRRHVEHPLLGPALQHFVDERDPTQPGHHDIDQQQIHGPCKVQCIERLSTVFRLERAVTGLTEYPLG
jgi:hypothetical protein